MKLQNIPHFQWAFRRKVVFNSFGLQTDNSAWLILQGIEMKRSFFARSK